MCYSQVIAVRSTIIIYVGRTYCLRQKCLIKSTKNVSSKENNYNKTTHSANFFKKQIVPLPALFDYQ
jgi:hypothetical protein